MRTLGVVLACVFLLGCGSLRDSAVRVANTSGVFLDSAESVLADKYRRALEACVHEANAKPQAEGCVAKEKSHYEPMWTAYEAARLAWLLLAAVIQEADAAGSDPEEPKLLRMLTKLSRAIGAFSDVSASKALPVGSP